MRNKTLEEIKNTYFDNCYLVVYAINTKISVINDTAIANKSLYTFIGLNTTGRRKFLGSYINDTTNNRFWLDVFESFKKKGINDILFLSSHDNKQLIKCLKISFPNSINVPSSIDIIDRFYNYFPDKYTTKIKDEVKSLFVQEKVSDYKNLSEFFKEKYKDNVILQAMTDKYLPQIEKLYNYNYYVRDVLFNTYKVEMFKKKIINVTIKHGYFNNIDDLLQLLLDDINVLDNFTSYHKKEWLNIIASFYTIRNKELEQLI